MLPLFLRLFLRLLLMALTVSVIGYHAGWGYALLTLLFFLCCREIWHLWNAHRLLNILKAPNHYPIQDGWGLWGEILYHLRKCFNTSNHSHKALQNEFDRFVKAIQASPNGVLLLDPDNTIQWANSVAAQHLGIDRQRDHQQNIAHLIRHPDFIAYLMHSKQSSTKHEPLTLSNMGPSYQQSITLKIIPYDLGQRLLMTQDVSDMIRTNKMRHEFIANVSHELKTPITVLAGSLENLQDLPLDAQEHAHVISSMQQQVKKMDTLVQDLLILARLEGDFPLPTLTPVNVEKLLQPLSNMAAQLSAGRHEIMMEIHPSMQLRGLHLELSSAFYNMISNAIHYSPKGGQIIIRWQPQFSVANENNEPSLQEATFSVQDQGIGIPAIYIPRLTERFYRLNDPQAIYPHGTGLGLAIVKHVLMRHQAYLTIESLEGQGSTFTAHFPAEHILFQAPPS